MAHIVPPLINMKLCGDLSGVSNEQYCNIAKEHQQLRETNDEDVFMLQEMEDLFANFQTEDLPQIVECDLASMDTAESSLTSESSRKQMEKHGGKFVSFLAKKQISCDIATLEKTVLASYVRFFYFELKTKSGGFYSPASLRCIRAGLWKFLQNIRNDINIIEGNRIKIKIFSCLLHYNHS